jgi:hypothetical protein
MTIISSLLSFPSTTSTFTRQLETLQEIEKLSRIASPTTQRIDPSHTLFEQFYRFTMLSRSTRASLLRLHRTAFPTNSTRSRIIAIQHQPNKQTSPLQRRTFISTPVIRKGITPDSSDPKAPNPQSSNAAAAAGASHVTEATPLSDKHYHEVSEHYLNVLLGELERIQEDGTEIEAEYSVWHLAPRSGQMIY